MARPMLLEIRKPGGIWRRIQVRSRQIEPSRRAVLSLPGFLAPLSFCGMSPYCQISCCSSPKGRCFDFDCVGTRLLCHRRPKSKLLPPSHPSPSSQNNSPAYSSAPASPSPSSRSHPPPSSSPPQPPSTSSTLPTRPSPQSPH